jgi:hypothetical protein
MNKQLSDVGFIKKYDRYERPNCTGDIHGFYEIAASLNYDSKMHPDGLTMHIQGYTDQSLSNDEKGIFFRGRLRDTAAMLKQRESGISIGNEHKANISEFELVTTIPYKMPGDKAPENNNTPEDKTPENRYNTPEDMAYHLSNMMILAYQKFSTNYARKQEASKPRNEAGQYAETSSNYNAAPQP